MPKWVSESSRDGWFNNILDRLRSWDWIETCPTTQAWIFSKHGKYSTWICHLYWYTNDVRFFKHRTKEYYDG